MIGRAPNPFRGVRIGSVAFTLVLVAGTVGYRNSFGFGLLDAIFQTVSTVHHGGLQLPPLT